MIKTVKRIYTRVSIAYLFMRKEISCEMILQPVGLLRDIVKFLLHTILLILIMYRTYVRVYYPH